MNTFVKQLKGHCEENIAHARDWLDKKIRRKAVWKAGGELGHAFNLAQFFNISLCQ